jgi:hypothetical protein
MFNHDDAGPSAVLKSKKFLVLAGTGIVWACLYLLFKLAHYEHETIPLLGWRWLSVVPMILAFSFVMQVIGLVRLRSVLPGAAAEASVESIAEILNIIFFNLPAGMPVKWGFDRWSRYRKSRDEYSQFFQDPPTDWIGQYYGHRQDFYRFTLSEKKDLIPHCVIFDNTRVCLPLERVAVLWESDVNWTTSPQLQSQTVQARNTFAKWARRHDSKLHDGVHLRLNSLALQNSNLTLSVRPVKYFESFFTNNIQDSPLPGAKNTLRQMWVSNGQMQPLENSEAANLFGVNHLIVTKEGHLLVAERSHRVAIRPGYFTPSAAGDFDHDDFGEPNSGCTIPFSRHAVTREIAFELGDAVANSLTEHVLLGIAREVARGGKPDSFFAARSSMTFTEIEKSWKDVRDRWEGKRLYAIPLGDAACRDLSSYLEAYPLMRSIEDFVTQYRSRISVTLKMNLELWIRYKLARLQRGATN